MKLNLAFIVAVISTFIPSPTNGAPVPINRVVRATTDTVYPTEKTIWYQGLWETPIVTLNRRQSSDSLLSPVSHEKKSESYSAGTFTPLGIHTPLDTQSPSSIHGPSAENLQWAVQKNPVGYLKGLAKHFRDSFQWSNTSDGWKWVQKKGSRIGDILKKAWNWFSRVVLRRGSRTEDGALNVPIPESPSQGPIVQFEPTLATIQEEAGQQGAVDVEGALLVAPVPASGSGKPPAPISPVAPAGAGPMQVQQEDDWVVVEHEDDEERKPLGPDNRPGWMTPPEKKMGLPDWPNKHACLKCKDGDPGPKKYPLKQTTAEAKGKAPAPENAPVHGPENRPGWMTPPEKKMGLPDWPNKHACLNCKDGDPGPRKYPLRQPAVEVKLEKPQPTVPPEFGPQNRPGWMTPPEKNMGLADWPGKHECVVCKDGNPGPRITEFNELRFKVHQPRLKPDNWWDWMVTFGRGKKLHGPENYDPDHKYYAARKTTDEHVLDHMTLPWKSEVKATLAPAPPGFEGYNPWGDPKPLHPNHVQDVNEIIASARAERDKGEYKFKKPLHFNSNRNRCGLRNFNGDLVRLPHRENDQLVRPFWDPNTDIGQYNTAALRLETEQRIMAGIRPLGEYEIEYRMPFYSDVKDWLGRTVLGQDRYGRPPAGDIELTWLKPPAPEPTPTQ